MMRELAHTYAIDQSTFSFGAPTGAATGDPGSLSLVIMTLTYSDSRSAFVMQSISVVRKTYDRHRSHARYLALYSRLAFSLILRPRP